METKLNTKQPDHATPEVTHRRLASRESSRRFRAKQRFANIDLVITSRADQTLSLGTQITVINEQVNTPVNSRKDNSTWAGQDINLGNEASINRDSNGWNADLKKLFDAFGWPCCICAPYSDCSCGKPLIPPWAEVYGIPSMTPFARRLSMITSSLTQTVFTTNHFPNAIRWAFEHYIDGTRHSLHDIIQEVFQTDSDPVTLEAFIVTNTATKGMFLQAACAGFACGAVLVDITQKWQELYFVMDRKMGWGETSGVAHEFIRLLLINIKASLKQIQSLH